MCYEKTCSTCEKKTWGGEIENIKNKKKKKKKKKIEMHIIICHKLKPSRQTTKG